MDQPDGDDVAFQRNALAVSQVDAVGAGDALASSRVANQLAAAETVNEEVNSDMKKTAIAETEETSEESNAHRTSQVAEHEHGSLQANTQQSSELPEEPWTLEQTMLFWLFDEDEDVRKSHSHRHRQPLTNHSPNSYLLKFV